MNMIRNFSIQLRCWDSCYCPVSTQIDPDHKWRVMWNLWRSQRVAQLCVRSENMLITRNRIDTTCTKHSIHLFLCCMWCVTVRDNIDIDVVRSGKIVLPSIYLCDWINAMLVPNSSMVLLLLQFIVNICCVCVNWNNGVKRVLFSMFDLFRFWSRWEYLTIQSNTMENLRVNLLEYMHKCMLSNAKNRNRFEIHSLLTMITITIEKYSIKM